MGCMHLDGFVVSCKLYKHRPEPVKVSQTLRLEDMASLLVLVIWLLGVSLSSATPTPLHFVELGETSSVSTESVPQADDGTSGPILINFNFPFGNGTPRTAYVSCSCMHARMQHHWDDAMAMTDALYRRSAGVYQWCHFFRSPVRLLLSQHVPCRLRSSIRGSLLE